MQTQKIVERFKDDIKQLGKNKKMFYAVIEIEPYGKSNFLKFGKGQSYQPARMAESDRKVASVCAQIMGSKEIKKFEGALFMQIDGYFSTKRVFDAPNLSKSICDALNDVVYYDDRQIIICICTKWYDKVKPRIEIFIKEYDADHDMVNIKTLLNKETVDPKTKKKEPKVTVKKTGRKLVKRIKKK